MSKKSVERIDPVTVALPPEGVDSHAHLDGEEFDQDREAVLARARACGVAHVGNVFLGPDDRLQYIDNVLTDRYFARIVPGSTTQTEVLRLLGPPTPQWTSYFAARDELVWEWLYCDGSNLMARFDVLFDGREGAVRTTFSRPDYRGPDGGVPPCGQMP